MASKQQKGRILDTLCALSGWTPVMPASHRLRPSKPRRSRPVGPSSGTCGSRGLEPLRFEWGHPERHLGQVPDSSPWGGAGGLVRARELRLETGVRAKLLGSPRPSLTAAGPPTAGASRSGALRNQARLDLPVPLHGLTCDIGE
jgi:hypothetical protein